jgi:hypothetical protein
MNIFLMTLFPDTLHVCSSLAAKHQDPYKTRDRIMVLYILIFIFVEDGKAKDSELGGSKCSLILIMIY